MTMSGSTIPPPRPAGARRENHRVRLSGEPTLYHGGGEVSSEKLAINLHLTKNPFCAKMFGILNDNTARQPGAEPRHGLNELIY